MTIKITEISIPEITISCRVSCRVCGSSGLSSKIRLSRIVVSDIPTLDNYITNQLNDRLIEPPVGWAISGRGNYTCPKCLAK